MSPCELCAEGPPLVSEHVLPSGRLDLHIPAGQMKQQLFRIAARQNPKRGFLFVSTVLGRHIPVRPAAHRDVLRRLASACLPHLATEPVLVMGFAETAVGLGAGVADEVARHHAKTAFLPTTRHMAEGRAWLGFSEPHSHASAHEILRANPHPAWDTNVTGRTLIIVDDEITTGTTIANLVTALQTGGLRISKILLVTLTDWSQGLALALLRDRAGVSDVHSVSLLQGGWTWNRDEASPVEEVPALQGFSMSPPWVPAPSAPFSAPRLGITSFAQTRLLDRLALAPFCAGDRVLVIGSGEHVWQPFLLAEEIEAQNLDVKFCATTRSPVHPGEAITSKITFPDHFGIGIPMYLHNVKREDWDRVIMMTETSAEGISAELRAALAPAEIVDGAGIVHRIGTAPAAHLAAGIYPQGVLS